MPPSTRRPASIPRSLIARELAEQLRAAARAFGAIVLTGPRRAGKTTLARSLWPDADYRLLEEPETIASVKNDPRAFIDGLRPPVILDEVQNAPELFNWVRARIDAAPTRRGRWILTGSQDFSLMEGVSESMAGRAAVLHLLPLSTLESPKVSPWVGGFPEVIARPRARRLWFESYLQTYIERDVRSVTAIRDLATFRRFLGLLATRNGQVLNRSDLAAPLGMTVPTVSQWLNVLEVTSVITLVPPYFENLGKRITRSPKLYFLDSGLASHLLGAESEAQLRASPLFGAHFEGFIAAELLKFLANAGRRREIYWYRDQGGLEVDFLLPGATTTLIEVKSTRTVRPDMATPLLRVAERLAPRPTRCFLLHGDGGAETQAIRPGVRAVDLRGLLDALRSDRPGSAKRAVK